MNKLQALNAFWSGFGLKAYDENSVPDNTPYPYLTYETKYDDFGNSLVTSVNLWYRSSSWSDVTAKEQEISDYITRGGRMVAYDGGSIWIQRASTWATRMGDENDEMIRRILLNVSIEFLN